MDNKNARLGKDLEMEKRLKAEVEGEHEDLKSVLKGAMKYIQKWLFLHSRQLLSHIQLPSRLFRTNKSPKIEVA